MRISDWSSDVCSSDVAAEHSMGAGQHQMTIALKEETASAYDVLEDIIVGNSDAICRVRDLIRQVARSDASVMITGPSGSGKEIVATALHHETQRAHNRFIAVKRSEEHTSELQSLMRSSYDVFCLKKKQKSITKIN